VKEKSLLLGSKRYRLTSVDNTSDNSALPMSFSSYAREALKSRGRAGNCWSLVKTLKRQYQKLWQFLIVYEAWNSL
jgi:hypothetical protein